VNGHLRRIGERLLQGLPQTGIKFQFFVVDLPETNAFTLPGGHVYVTRKLIAFARSEDELAGVIAHELGHGLMHHTAVDLSRLFREILGVNEVTDRKDIFEKYNRLIENARRKNVRIEDHEEGQQLEADRAGLYAMIAAGYDPQAFSSFWDRFAETKGKTGSWFTDIFGTTKPEQKRLREMLKVASTIPAQCINSRAARTSDEFKQWQSAVVVYSGTGRKEQLHAVLSKMNLAPPLRGEVTHLRFSPDGKYILAQDDGGISVLSREPFALLFRIEAPEAKPAMFSPDSQSVVFYNSNLHVERWNASSGTKSAAYEVILPNNWCIQTKLSSDGATLACYDNHFNLNLYNVATSELIFQKKKFYSSDPFEAISFILALRAGNDFNLLNMEFSPDNHYFAAARSDENRIVIKFGDIDLGGEPDKVVVGVDLTTRKALSIGGDLKNLLTGGFTFYSPTSVVGEYFGDADRSGVYTFPEGKKVEQFKMAGRDFIRAQQGDFFVVRPIADYPAGVFDMKSKRIIVGNKQAAIDVYGNTFVAERRNGELGLYDLATTKPLSIINLPQSSLGRLRVAQVSPDLKWLAASERSRGAVWDLTTGKRVFHIRGFRGAYFADDGNIYADFPKYEKTERTIARMTPAQQSVSQGFELPENGVDQYGSYLVYLDSDKYKIDKLEDEKERKAREKEEKKQREEDKKNRKAAGDDDDDKDADPAILTANISGQKNMHMAVRDVQGASELWTRYFPEEVPLYWGDAQDGTLTLAWAVTSTTARDILKSDAALSQRLAGMGDKAGDYLLQVLEMKTGKVLGQLLIETGKGAFRVDEITTAGDWVVVSDTQNRVLVYSLSAGQLKQRFFGDRAVVNAGEGLLCVENEPGQLIIYDLNTGEKRDEFSFSSPVSLIQFAEGKRLFILTANQTAYLLSIAGKNATAVAR
jgi:WD40 repeat protein